MTTATKPFKAAVIQAAAIPTDSIECALKAASLIREAASNGAKVQVFPEAFLGGYPKGNSFGSPIGLRKPTGRADYATYYQQAIDLNGEEIEIINEAVRETGAVVVIGCIERDGGTLYCTALYFSGKDGLVGKHRKLMPTAGERLADVVRTHLHARGQTLDDPHEGGAVRLSGRQPTKHGPDPPTRSHAPRLRPRCGQRRVPARVWAPSSVGSTAP